MTSLFAGCENLTSLPEISKWDTSSASEMSYIFSGCLKLISITDISK